MKIKLTRGQVGKDKGLDITVKSADGRAKKMAPTWKIVLGVQAGEVTEDEYLKQYIEHLERLGREFWKDFYEWARDHRNGEVKLLCYCPDKRDGMATFCHTYLLIRWLTSHPKFGAGFETTPEITNRLYELEMLR